MATLSCHRGLTWSLCGAEGEGGRRWRLWLLWGLGFLVRLWVRVNWAAQSGDHVSLWV